jgi:hypothetical protein
MGQRKYGDALELLMAGAEALFKAGQSASAADLALLVLELYSQSHTAVNDESRGLLLPPGFFALCCCWFLTMNGRKSCRSRPSLHACTSVPPMAFQSASGACSSYSPSLSR